MTRALAAVLLAAGCTAEPDPRYLSRAVAPPSCACPTDAGGPRAMGVEVVGASLYVLLSAPVVVPSWRSEAVTVSTLQLADSSPMWVAASLRAIALDARQGGPALRVDVDGALSGLVRLVLRGTVAAPIVGLDGVPFAGAEGGYPVTTGADYVWQGAM